MIFLVGKSGYRQIPVNFGPGCRVPKTSLLSSRFPPFLFSSRFPPVFLQFFSFPSWFLPVFLSFSSRVPILTAEEHSRSAPLRHGQPLSWPCHACLLLGPPMARPDTSQPRINRNLLLVSRPSLLRCRLTRTSRQLIRDCARRKRSPASLMRPNWRRNLLRLTLRSGPTSIRRH